MATELKEAQKVNEELKSKLKPYQELDPDVLDKLKSESQVMSTSHCTCIDILIACSSIYRRLLQLSIGGLTTFLPSKVGARTNFPLKKAI